MKALSKPAVRVVIYEGRGARPLAGPRRFELTRELLDRGIGVLRAGVGGESSPTAAAPPTGAAMLIVLGEFDSAAPPEALDTQGEVRIVLRDLTGLDAAAVLGQIDQLLGDEDLAVNRPGVSGSWKPWFPVIDYSRCTNCMQCLSFCLFNVYGVDQAGKIQVQHNDNCKTDCPACSRVCPAVAIMFPKYSAGPINGDVVRDSDVQREAMKIDISALLGGDIYAQLKNRTAAAKERFAKERDEKRALSERMRCLQKLAEKMDVPMEVLTTLPSPDEIQRRAADAAARAQAAKTAG